MVVKVNGSPQEYKDADICILQILKDQNVEKPELVAVQLNGEFVNKDNYESTSVKDQDELDFLFPMGGGTFIF